MPSLNLISGGEPERIRGAFAEAALFDVLGSDDNRSHGAGFEFPMKKSEFWAPLAVGERAKRRAGYWLQMVARLRRGITPSQAQTEMNVVGKQLEQQYPDENAGYGFYVNPPENHVAGNVRTPLLVLLGAVGFAGLFLARAEARSREIMVRSAMGASRGSLIRQLVMEAPRSSRRRCGHSRSIRRRPRAHLARAARSSAHRRNRA